MSCHKSHRTHQKLLPLGCRCVCVRIWNSLCPVVVAIFSVVLLVYSVWAWRSRRKYLHASMYVCYRNESAIKRSHTYNSFFNTHTHTRITKIKSCTFTCVAKNGTAARTPANIDVLCDPQLWQHNASTHLGAMKAN